MPSAPLPRIVRADSGTAASSAGAKNRGIEENASRLPTGGPCCFGSSRRQAHWFRSFLSEGALSRGVRGPRIAICSVPTRSLPLAQGETGGRGARGCPPAPRSGKVPHGRAGHISAPADCVERMEDPDSCSGGRSRSDREAMAPTGRRLTWRSLSSVFRESSNGSPAAWRLPAIYHPKLLAPSTAARPRRFCWLAAKVPMFVAPERRKSKKSKPEYLHVWQTLRRMRYSSIPFGVERPSIVRRSLANALIACSALLLFQGTPSWLRK